MTNYLKNKTIFSYQLIAVFFSAFTCSTASFSQPNTSDMVQLQTGNFNYNIPLMTVPGPGGGYPINLYYTPDAAIKPEADASWVGLGWNLNPGSISRTVMGLPDDWNGKSTSVINYNQKWNQANGYLYSTAPGTRASSTYNAGNFKIFLKAKSNLLNYGSLYFENIVNSQNYMTLNQGNGDYYDDQGNIQSTDDPQLWLKGNYKTDVYSNPYSSDTYNNAIVESSYNTVSFPAYDYYSITGPGMSGRISPKIYEYRNLLQEANVLTPYPDGSKSKEVKYYDNYNAIEYYQKAPSQYYFQFIADPSGYAVMQQSKILDPKARNNYEGSGDPFLETTVPGTGASFYNSDSKHPGQGKHIEYFTNSLILENPTDAYNRGFIETPSQLNQRNQGDLYDPNGIGAFSVTLEDGTTYHYSVPVYQFEELIYFQDVKNTNNFVEQKSLNMYATDWLLTAITGPDFVDNGTIGMIDDADEGYYVQFNYGKWTDGYLWCSPSKAGTFNPGPTGSNTQSYAIGRKQIYYLNSIQTKTHTAYFVKSLRDDGIGQLSQADKATYSTTSISRTDPTCGSSLPSSYPSYQGTVQHIERLNAGAANKQLKLDRIILLNNSDAANYSIDLSGGNNYGSNNLFGSNLGEPVPVGGFYEVQNTLTTVANVSRYSQTYTVNCSMATDDLKYFYSHYQNNVLDVGDVQNDMRNIQSLSLSEIEFNYDYILCNNTPNSPAHNGNKLTLKTVQTYGIGRSYFMPPYSFHYLNEVGGGYNEIGYTTKYVDSWGYFANISQDDHMNKRSSDAWCLYDITTPTGAEIQAWYESDTYNQEAVFGAQFFDSAWGGGIRVQYIYLIDEVGNKYKTTYTYTDPATNRTSGTTSYAPSKQDRYIPYLHEIPRPGVMYGYVTVENKGLNNNSFQKTRYQFDVLSGSNSYSNGDGTPALGLTIGDKFSVSDPYINSSSNPDYRFSTDKTTDKENWAHICPRTVQINDNTASLGRLLQTALINQTGQTLQTTNYQYYVPGKDTINNGISQETFGEIKQYTQWDPPDANNKQSSSIYWLMTTNTRTSYASLLKSITTTTANNISKSVTFKQYDLVTGNPLVTENNNSDGTKITTTIVPAYTQYSDMASKIIYYDSKNMLSQKTASYSTFTDGAGNSAVTAAQLQLWSGQWNYWDYDQSSNSFKDVLLVLPEGRFPPWHPQKSYAWKSALNNDGTFNSPFTLANNDPHWQLTGAMTHFDHFSNPSEAIDINNIYSSNKMNKNNLYSIASSGTSSGSVFTHAGFEDFLNTSYYEGEVMVGGTTQMLGTSSMNPSAHSGNYMAKLSETANSISSLTSGNFSAPVFKCQVMQTTDKGRTYKASVWVHKSSSPTTYLTAILDGSNGSSPFYDMQVASLSPSNGVNLFDGLHYTFSTTPNIVIGNWTLLTVFINVPVNYTPSNGSLGINGLNVFVVNLNTNSTTTANSYVDDFRIQPVDSPVNGYIYDSHTGLKTAVLNNENFATYYTYDFLGRMTQINKETIKGIKVVKHNDYHIANQ